MADHFISGYNEAEHRWKDLRTRFMKGAGEKDRLEKARQKILERRANRRASREPGGASPSSVSRTESSKLWTSEQKAVTSDVVAENEHTHEEEEISNQGRGESSSPQTEGEPTSSSPQSDGGTSSTVADDVVTQEPSRISQAGGRRQSSTARRRLHADDENDETQNGGGFDPFDGVGLGTEERALAFIVAVLELKWMENPITYKNARDPVDPKHGARPPLLHPFKSLMSGPMIEQNGWNFNVAFAHVLPQSSAITRLRPDFVGHLESIKADWRKMQEVCNFAIGDLDPEKGQHESSGDPEGTANAMRTLIETNTEVQMALCLLYKNDFLIFGYSFPPACSILFENVND